MKVKIMNRKWRKEEESERWVGQQIDEWEGRENERERKTEKGENTAGELLGGGGH